MPRFLRVGVTGGIASGKSQVVRRLAAAGFHRIDLDKVAHEVMEPGRVAFAEVVEAFGPEVVGVGGRIDRAVLGRIVFADAQARARLDAIVHPRVREEENARAAAAAGPVVTEAALLVEAGMHLRFDRLVVVHCAEETQRGRLMQRDGLSAEAAQQRIAAQMPLGEKRAYGHFEVSTEGTLADTEARADELARELQALAVAAAGRGGAPLDRARAARGLALGPRRGPRGLDPAGFLEAVGTNGGIELPVLAARLVPPARGPWYRAARPGEGDPRPRALSGPVAAYCGLRAPGDLDYAAAAMASVARLTHAEAAAIGEACVLTLAASEAWASPGLAPDALLGRASAWRARARRWAGGDFADPLSLLREPAGGEERALAAMLVGSGGEEGEAPWDAAPLLEALAAAVGADRPPA
jgi:dephospho-CoA kinase